MSELIANRYEIIKTLGQGGMANVYLALDTVLNREVAVKVLKADMSNDDVSLERFRREANASTHISHPNIVDIYDVGDDGNKHYIVMEYVKGYTLKQLLKRRGAIPAREAVWMIKQLSGALLEAHKNGLIHRDVKSQNVLIKDDGTVKLADFGIAVLNNSLQLTSKDSVLGSVHYLAPELAKGASASMQSDIYSLGIVFYELLTGDVPFKAETPVQVALMHVKNELPDVRKFNPTIPQSVINVLLKATAKSPKNRYANIALMIKDLNTCLDETRINEKPLNIKSNTKTKSNDFNISASAKVDISEEESLKGKGFNILLIVAISLISIIALFLILMLSGVFSSNKIKYVKVPDVVGLSQTSAVDAIYAEGLEISYPIKEVLTSDKDAGFVIEIQPNVESEVELGTKLTLTVSKGKYAIAEDYVGKNINTIRDVIPSNIKLNIVKVVTDEKEEGTILKQTGLCPGDQYDPNEVNLVFNFEVAGSDETYVPQIIGLSLDVAEKMLDDSELNYEVIKTNKEDLDSNVYVKYKPDIIYKCEPDAGSLIQITEDTSIKIYYYEETKHGE